MGATSGSAAIEIDRDIAAILGHGHMGPAIDRRNQSTVDPGPIASPSTCQGELQGAITKARNLITKLLIKNNPINASSGIDPRLQGELITEVQAVVIRNDNNIVNTIKTQGKLVGHIGSADWQNTVFIDG